MYNIINFLPPLFFILFLYYNVKKVGRVVSLSSFIIAIYTLSMFSYSICSLSEPTYYYNLETLLIVFFSILFLTHPLSSFEKKITLRTTISKLKTNKYKVIVFSIILISVYSILFFAKNIVHVLNSDLSTIRDEIIINGGFYESSIFSKVAVLGAYLSPIALFFYFYTLVAKESKRLGILLVISSTSFVFYTLNVAGRDGIVIWVFTYIALFSLYYPLLSNKIITNQRKVLLTSAVLILPFFFIITIGRFGDVSDKSVLFSIFDYLGQQPNELSNRIDKLNVIKYNGEPRLIYPLIMDVIDIFKYDIKSSEMNNRYELRSISMSLDLNTYRFVYYIGDVLTELGVLGLIFFTLLLHVIFRLNLKIIDNKISISRLLISFSWYMIIIVGVFYFYYGQLIGNVFLLIPFLIYFYLNFKRI